MQEEELPLPPGVRPKHGAWHYVERHKWKKLCRIDEGRARLYERLIEVCDSAEGNVWYAILSYIAKGMKGLAPATQKHYTTTSYRMLHHFGHFRIEEIEPTHCAQYRAWCEENNRAVTGNRERSFMSSVWEYAMGKGWARYNPWRGSRRSPEVPSGRYVEHKTLVATLDRAPPEIYPLMGVGYVLGIRQTDLRLAQKSQVAGDILHVIESKTGKPNEHEVTPTVRYLLERAAQNTESIALRYEAAAIKLDALSQFGRAREHRLKAASVRASPFIFLSKRGLPWSEWGLQSALRRFKAGFRFRDLRSKAQTDSDKNILGHTGQMRGRYQKKRRLAAVK